jgi:hypothetical protein
VLTLEQCRRILGPDIGLDDEELADMRDQLYALARIAMDADVLESDESVEQSP